MIRGPEQGKNNPFTFHVPRSRCLLPRATVANRSVFHGSMRIPESRDWNLRLEGAILRHRATINQETGRRETDKERRKKSGSGGNRSEGGGVHRGRNKKNRNTITKTREAVLFLTVRAVSRRHQSEVECVQSLIMRPSEKKRHWKSRSSGARLCAHAFFCRRASSSSVPPSAATLTKSPAPPYIVYRRIVHSHTFSFWPNR